MVTNIAHWFKIQQIANKGLCGFLTGETLTNRWQYPFKSAESLYFWANWRHQLQQALDELQLASLFMRQCPAFVETGVAADQIAVQLGCLYHWLYETLPQALGREDRYINFNCLKQFDNADYLLPSGYLNPLISLADYLSHDATALGYSVYLHGSLSTMDYVPASSDVDILIIVKRIALDDPSILIEIRRRLIHSLRWVYQIDYSQHHGYAVLAELDLDFYDESLFPIGPLQYLTVLTGRGTLVLNHHPHCTDPAIPFKQMVAAFHDLHDKRNTIKGWYATKLWLQSALLLPTLYLQACGIPVYKRDSFDLVKNQVPEPAWHIIDKATRVRAAGVQRSLLSRPLWKRWLAQAPNPWVVSLLHRKIFNRVPESARLILGEDWLTEAICLSDTLSKMLETKYV